MRVAVLFECSGVVREAFRAKGHYAVSCDIKPTDIPGNHIQEDVTNINWEGYDLIICHPPCTAVCVSGNRYYSGTQDRINGLKLINWCWLLPCKRVCIENPVGVINSFLPHMPKPQYIQPWQFGHNASKKTGLWKRNLPDLVPTSIIVKNRYANQTASGQNNLPPSACRAVLRSKTYQGIADAMANQWVIEGTK